MYMYIYIYTYNNYSTTKYGHCESTTWPISFYTN